MMTLQKALNLIPLGLMLLGSAVAIANIQGGNASRHDDPAPASFDATRDGYLIAVQLAGNTHDASLDARNDARQDFAAETHQ
jgi:hypothetical protein